MSVINEKQVILGEDLEPKESLTVDGSTGKKFKEQITRIQNYLVSNRIQVTLYYTK